MANAQIAARLLGDDYQAFYFWINAIKMLIPTSLISTVSYEESEFSPFDDVTVNYSQFINNEQTNTQYNRDYIQCKFKINGNETLTWQDLIDPKYYHNKESILKRAYNLYLNQKDHNFRLILCTSICFESKDLLASYISNTEFGLNIFRLSQAKDKRTISMLQSISNNIGCFNGEELITFLSLLRFHQGKSIHDLKIELRQWSSLVNIRYDLSKDSEIFTSLIKKANLRRNTLFDKKTIETICINENLFGKERIKIGIIGIGKKDARTEKVKNSGDKCLDLSPMFVDRKLKEGVGWEDVIKTSKKFVESFIEYGKDYIVSLTGTFSTAFLLGKLIGFKYGDIALENRNGVWVKEFAIPCTLIEEHNNQFIDECEINCCENAVVCIRIGENDILEDVKEYVRPEKIVDVRMLHIYNNDFNMVNNSAWDFVENNSKSIKEFIKKLSPKNVHLFYRGPAEIMFILGQYSNEWGECQIYDFDFQASQLKEKKYFKGIKI